MTANLTDRFRNVIICEDIRREENGKLILIGVFSNEIILHEIPGVIMTATYLEFKPQEIFEEVNFIYCLNGKEIAKINAKMDIANPDDWIGSSLPPIPLKISESGNLTLSASIGSRDSIIIMQKAIRQR